MKKALLAAAAAATLTACQTGPAVVDDKHTGQKIAFSSSVDAYSGLMNSLKVRAFHSNKSGYGVETQYMNYGWLFPNEVWSLGKQFPYSNTNSQATMCGGAGGCITLERGTITFTKEQFGQAAKSGFEFRLIGTNGSVTGKIPAKLFSEVLKVSGS